MTHHPFQLMVAVAISQTLALISVPTAYGAECSAEPRYLLLGPTSNDQFIDKEEQLSDVYPLAVTKHDVAFIRRSPDGDALMTVDVSSDAFSVRERYRYKAKPEGWENKRIATLWPGPVIGIDKGSGERMELIHNNGLIGAADTLAAAIADNDKIRLSNVELTINDRKIIACNGIPDCRNFEGITSSLGSNVVAVHYVTHVDQRRVCVIQPKSAAAPTHPVLDGAEANGIMPPPATCILDKPGREAALSSDGKWLALEVSRPLRQSRESGSMLQIYAVDSDQPRPLTVGDRSPVAIQDFRGADLFDYRGSFAWAQTGNGRSSLFYLQYGDGGAKETWLLHCDTKACQDPKKIAFPKSTLIKVNSGGASGVWSVTSPKPPIVGPNYEVERQHWIAPFVLPNELWYAAQVSVTGYIGSTWISTLERIALFRLSSDCGI